MNPREKKVKLGFVGAGFVGQIAHIANFRDVQTCELHALSELRPELATAVARHYGFQKTYASTQELLEDPLVDAVVAITRRPHTGPTALEILQSGKHLLTEKPLCHSVAQAESLLAAAQTSGAIHSVGYMRRHDAGVAKAHAKFRDLIASNDLGPLLSAKAYCWGGDSYQGSRPEVAVEEYAYPELKSWPLSPDFMPADLAMDYANFVNVYCHTLNLLRFFLGEPTQVVRANLRNPKEQEISLEFERIPAQLNFGVRPSTDWQEGFEFEFAKGSFALSLPPAFAKTRIATYQWSGRNGEVEKSSPAGGEKWAFRRQAEAFVDDVRTKKFPLASAEDAIEDLRLIEKIWMVHLKELTL